MHTGRSQAGPFTRRGRRCSLAALSVLGWAALADPLGRLPSATAGSGSAWLDSATSVLRRMGFRLTRLREDDAPRRLEGDTTFTEPTPFITLPESTLAYWWRRGPRGDDEWGFPDVLQIIHVTRVDYRDARPRRRDLSAGRAAR